MQSVEICVSKKSDILNGIRSATKFLQFWLQISFTETRENKKRYSVASTDQPSRVPRTIFTYYGICDNCTIYFELIYYSFF